MHATIEMWESPIGTSKDTSRDNGPIIHLRIKIQYKWLSKVNRFDKTELLIQINSLYVPIQHIVTYDNAPMFLFTESNSDGQDKPSPKRDIDNITIFTWIKCPTLFPWLRIIYLDHHLKSRVYRIIIPSYAQLLRFRLTVSDYCLLIIHSTNMNVKRTIFGMNKFFIDKNVSKNVLHFYSLEHTCLTPLSKWCLSK